jgi:hypothetical protein
VKNCTHCARLINERPLINDNRTLSEIRLVYRRSRKKKGRDRQKYRTTKENRCDENKGMMHNELKGTKCIKNIIMKLVSSSRVYGSGFK